MMPDLAIIAAGLGDAFSPANLSMALAGVVLGQFVGAVPGIGPVIVMAIAVPFTFTLEPLAAIGFLVGISKGGNVGGAIPAILINTPGTPDAAATALDGHPMARAGKPLKAMKLALYSSVSGDTFSDILLITVSAPLALVALRMGPVEVVCLMIFALSIITGLVGNSLGKGMAAAAFGLLCAMVGLDPEHASPRLEFGYFELDSGLSLPGVAISMLVVSEVIYQLATRSATSAAVPLPAARNADDARLSRAEFWSCRFTLLRGGLIGAAIGAVPGIGSSAAAFLSYASAKHAALRRNASGAARESLPDFGRGNPHGIAATESANSAVVGANLIPLLTLGLPGNVGAALIISALLIQGIQPGPLLFAEQGRLIYGLFGLMLAANAANLIVGQFGMRLWVLVVRAPASVIFASALLLCFVGVYSASGDIFGLKVMLLFSVIGVVMRFFGFSVVAFIIAFILGPRFELSLSQALTITNRDPAALLAHPVGLAFLLLAALAIYVFAFRRHAAPA